MEILLREYEFINININQIKHVEYIYIISWYIYIYIINVMMNGGVIVNS